jgi:hypothetical protein
MARSAAPPKLLSGAKINRIQQGDATLDSV